MEQNLERRVQVACGHYRGIGPVACPMPAGHPDAVGIWRWYFCENCGAFKHWDARDFATDQEGLKASEWKLPKFVDLSRRITPAVDILKSIQGDRWTMMSEAERLKLDLSHDFDLDGMRKKMAAHALDVLTGERAQPAATPAPAVPWFGNDTADEYEARVRGDR